MKLEKYPELVPAQIAILEEMGITIKDESLSNALWKKMVGSCPTRMIKWLQEIKTWCISYKALMPITGHILDTFRIPFLMQ